MSPREIMVMAFIWCLCAAVGYVIGGFKGRQGAGTALGVLFGPLGWLIAVLLPPTIDHEVARRREIERRMRRRI